MIRSITRIKTLDTSEHPVPLNPFNQNPFDMGTYLHRNIAVMSPEHENNCSPYLIVIDRYSGEQVKIEFDCEVAYFDDQPDRQKWGCKLHGPKREPSPMR